VTVVGAAWGVKEIAGSGERHGGGCFGSSRWITSLVFAGITVLLRSC
jgi:hypothetical protein